MNSNIKKKKNLTLNVLILEDTNPRTQTTIVFKTFKDALLQELTQLKAKLTLRSQGGVWRCSGPKANIGGRNGE